MSDRHRRVILLLSVCLAQLFVARWVAADDTLRGREEKAIKAAVARVAPSVVRIETVGGLERVGQILIGTGPTTGLVVSADGYILSSAFNFVQKPDSILVTLDGGARHAARLVATDHSRMLVLLKIDADGKLAVPEAAPLAGVRVGQWAVAVGRTFESSQPNLSVGIVSALDRIWGKAVQTDAKISPNNYGGPLVDIAGRVIGVLVPMSPEGGAEVAGVEWYDSGIGFAIPLESVLQVLPKLEAGTDLHAGLLGVNMKGADIYGQPAMIAAARATGPAYKAGFRSGDRIVEAAGRPIERQAQLKHELGRLYAGDKFAIAALRGSERIEHEVELADKIEPYEFPFLGVLPLREPVGAETAGVTIRYVYPDSPAAAVGLKPGDRIESFAGQAVKDLDEIAQKMQVVLPGEKVKLTVKRGSETLELEPQLGRLGEGLPGDLPPAHAALEAQAGADADRPETGVVNLKVPEFENECLAYVPENYDARVPYGVVVWLHPPGGLKSDELLELWKPLCQKYEFILVAPKASDRAKWQPTEVRFIRRVLDEAIKNYSTDPARIVVHGHEAGGAMAYLAGAANEDVFRAIAAVGAPLPRLVQVPPTDPVNRLAFYTTLATKSELTAGVEATIKHLRAAKYPVSVKEIGEQERYLTADELSELVRWFDTLDRI